MRGPALALAVFLSLAGMANGQEISARAEAGLGGVARAGRWMPVIVTLENNRQAVDALVTVSVGDEKATRPLALASPSRKRIEFFLRAPDSDAVVAQVDVTAAGASLASARVPVRIVPSDAAFALCVSSNGVTPADVACTAMVTAEAFPRSWRGLDAADDVAWPDGASPATLDEAQRLAYERVVAVHTWNGSTAMAVSAPRFSESARTGNHLGVLATYTLLLAGLGFVLARLARRPVYAYAVALVVMGGGTAAVMADGRFGAPVLIREASVMRAGSVLDGAEVHVTARATAASAGTLELQSSLADTQTSEAAAMSQAVARGQTLTFDVAGFTTTAPVRLSWRDRELTIENRLASALTDCTLPGAFSITSVTRIESGASFTATAPTDVEDAALVCTIERPELRLTLANAKVTHETRGVLVVDLRHHGAPR